MFGLEKVNFVLCRVAETEEEAQKDIEETKKAMCTLGFEFVYDYSMKSMAHDDFICGAMFNASRRRMNWLCKKAGLYVQHKVNGIYFLAK